MNTKVLLILSLLFNAGLAMYALRKPAGPIPAETTTSAPIQSEMIPQEPSKSDAAPSGVTNTVTRQFNWEAVESPDYKQYIANLRAIGCPEETIRDIIVADVSKLYDEKKKTARGAPKKFEYWKGGNSGFLAGMVDAASIEKSRALDDEKNNVLRALGIEPDFKTQMAEMINPLETMFDFLPEAKRAQLLKAMTDMQTKMAKALEGGGQSDPTVIAKVQKEMEQQVKQMLTPEEGLAFDLRMSITANLMRSQLTGFEPTEDEFLKVFNLRKPFDDQFSPMLQGNETEPERQRRQEADKQLKELMKQALGTDRYAAYERAQDYTYQQMHRSAKAAELDTPQANQLYDMKKVAQDQAAALRTDRNLTREQRNKALAEIRLETERAMQGVLGPKGWEHYNQPMNVNWLDGINRPSAPRQPLQAPTPGNR